MRKSCHGSSRHQSAKCPGCAAKPSRMTAEVTNQSFSRPRPVRVSDRCETAARLAREASGWVESVRFFNRMTAATETCHSRYATDRSCTFSRDHSAAMSPATPNRERDRLFATQSSGSGSLLKAVLNTASPHARRKTKPPLVRLREAGQVAEAHALGNVCEGQAGIGQQPVGLMSAHLGQQHSE